MKKSSQDKDVEKATIKHDAMVGKKFFFSGGLFSGKKEVPQEEYEVLNWRWGSARIINTKNLNAPQHPTVEFLIKKEGMKRSRWTRPFPVPEIELEGYNLND